MALMCASVENRPSLSIPKFVVIAADLAPNSKFKKRLWSHWDTCVTTRPHRPFLHTRFLEIGTERPPKGPQNRRVVIKPQYQMAKANFSSGNKGVLVVPSPFCRVTESLGQARA